MGGAPLEHGSGFRGKMLLGFAPFRLQTGHQRSPEALCP